MISLTSGKTLRFEQPERMKKQKEADDEKDYSCSDDDQASPRFEVIDIVHASW